MQLELKEVNELVKYFTDQSAYSLVQQENPKLKYKRVSNTLIEPHMEQEGHEGQNQIVFQIKDDLFVVITVSSDSYGGNMRISNIQFAKPVEKKVTNYESV